MVRYPGIQYSIFRILLGCWLVLYFNSFLSFSNFYFGKSGIFKKIAIWGFTPNIFEVFNSPLQIKGVILTFMLFGFLFIFGIYRKISAFILWFGWASLVGGYALQTPIDGYVGWLLLASCIIPNDGPISLGQKGNWEMPKEIYWGAWIVFTISYSFSGFIKLYNSSWREGDALSLLLNGPLAHPIGAFLAKLPDLFLKILTWLTLGLELFCFPLFLSKALRPFLWWGITLFHIGILFTLNFGDLSWAMILSQIFILDIRWVPGLKKLGQKYPFWQIE